ncbi:MAG: hypothetical protein K6B14_01035 [Lachnospiraceae bacterium]|nr:hypothetical protein [Lachnospiraceae bacterium]
MTDKISKKLISIMCVVGLTFSLFGCAPAEKAGVKKDEGDRVTIGVSIWNTTDLLGSRTKRIIDATADALDVDVIYCEHEYDPSMLRTSVNKLCAAGCEGILFCPGSNTDMVDAINTCDREGVYIAQYYSRIDALTWPEVYELSVESDRYVGAVYEDEVENGYNLTYYLLNNGDRQIGVMCGAGDEVTFDQRRLGADMAVAEWNIGHPEDMAHLSQTVYAKATAESCHDAVHELLEMMSHMDGLLVGSGKVTQVEAAMEALEFHKLSQHVDLVGSGFLDDMKEQLAGGGIYAQSGGNICDPLYAFLLVYKVIRGEYEMLPDTPGYELECPYIYINSADEYDEYVKYFIDSMPYDPMEIRDLEKYSVDELSVAAETLSVRDVKTRHGG